MDTVTALSIDGNQALTGCDGAAFVRDVNSVSV